MIVVIGHSNRIVQGQLHVTAEVTLIIGHTALTAEAVIRNTVADCTDPGHTVLRCHQSETLLLAALALMTLVLIWLVIRNIVAHCTGLVTLSLVWWKLGALLMTALVK